MKILRKLLLTSLLLGLTLFSACNRAEEYPARPVKLVIPFSAGNASDLFARQYASIASKHLGQAIHCVNISGDQTKEAIAYVHDQPADGYTMMEITPTLLLREMRSLQAIEQSRSEASAPVLVTDIIFRDAFEPLLQVQADIQLLGVAPDSEFQSLDQLLAYAKEHPGQLTIGGVSPEGLDEYIAAGFAKAAGIQWNYVSYPSSDKALEALANGSLDIYQDKLIRFISLAGSGEVRPLAVLHDTRLDIPGLEDCPTTVEKGIPFTQGSWRGFVVKKGTPQEIKDILIESLKAAYHDPAYQALEEKYHTNIRDGYLEAEAWRAQWDAEYEVLREVLGE